MNNELQKELSAVNTKYDTLIRNNNSKKKEVIKHDTSKDIVSKSSIDFINGL